MPGAAVRAAGPAVGGAWICFTGDVIRDRDTLTGRRDGIAVCGQAIAGRSVAGIGLAAGDCPLDVGQLVSEGAQEGEIAAGFVARAGAVTVQPPGVPAYWWRVVIPAVRYSASVSFWSAARMAR